MLNLLGDIWPDGGTPPWAQVLALPGTHLHLYGKAHAAKGRKMGHSHHGEPFRRTYARLLKEHAI